MGDFRFFKKFVKVGALATGLLSTASHAAVTVTIQESGSDVVASFSGSLDTAALTCAGVATLAILDFDSTTDYAYVLGSAPGGAASDACVASFTTAESFGGLPGGSTPDSGSGGPIGVEVVGGANDLFVPSGYTSGSAISGSSTFTGETISSLGLTAGTFLFDYGDDTVTFVIVAPAIGGGGGSAQSVPATPLWTLLLTVGLIAGIVRFRRAA